jgi:ComF family protein
MEEPQPLGDAILDLLYPPVCLECQTPLDNPANQFFCKKCWSNVEYIGDNICLTCGVPIADISSLQTGKCENCRLSKPAYDSLRSVAKYEGAIRTAVHSLKFKYKTKLAPFLGEMLLNFYRENYQQGQFDMIVPIPLHWLKKWMREFNQSELLSNYVGSEIGCPVESKILKRKRYTKPQSRIKGRRAKFKNIYNAFKVKDPSKVQSKKIFVIDDIMTTGVTVNEASRVLKEAGAAEVHALVLTRAYFI